MNVSGVLWPHPRLMTPILCLHGGSILVLTNYGLLLEVEPCGAVARILTCREPIRMGEALADRAVSGLRSDGVEAVAMPVDVPDAVLTLGADGVLRSSPAPAPAADPAVLPSAGLARTAVVVGGRVLVGRHEAITAFGR